MKKLIIIGILYSLMTNGCAGTQKAKTDLEPDFLKEIENIAIMVAKSIKYYDNLPNNYIGEDEIEGQCGDYAVIFALKTGANIVIQQNETVGVKNGIYRLVHISEDFQNAVQNILVENFGENYRSGFYGPWIWNGIDYYRLICHPQIGIFHLELIEEKTIITHFGINMQQNGPHVWNELNGIIIDVCWADVHNMMFFGLDK
jgi:archaellum component FlaF (FlaF/FlaG flagellin family)